MNCPRCNTLLTPDSIIEFNVKIETDRCDSCGGVWFDKGELSKIEKIVEATMFEIRKMPNKEEQRKPLHCPSCNSLQLMHKEEHYRDRKVIIDYCPSCKGIWLDKGELQAIQKENILKSLATFFKWIVLTK